MTAAIVDIHPRKLLRVGLSAVLTDDPAIGVVGIGACGKHAVKLLKQHRVNVLMLYDQLEGEDKFELARKLIRFYPELKIVMIGVEAHPTYIARSIAAGAHDHVTEASTAREIRDSVKNAALGELPPASSSSGKIMECLNSKTMNPAMTLTFRERQTLRHIAYGRLNQEIACCMKISVETVRERVRNIVRRLAMKDRTEVAVWAVRNGVV